MYFLNRNNSDDWLWWREFTHSPYTISISMSIFFMFLMFLSYKLFNFLCENKNFKNYIYIYILLSFLFISPILIYLYDNNLNIKQLYYIYIIFGCIEFLCFYFIPIILKLFKKYPKLKINFKFKRKPKNNIPTQSN